MTMSVIQCPACRSRWLEEHEEPGSHAYACCCLNEDEHERLDCPIINGTFTLCAERPVLDKDSQCLATC